MLFLIVLKNFAILLAHFIGHPLGVNLILLILTVQFWTSRGKSLLVLFWLPSVLYPLAWMCLSTVFVVQSLSCSVTSCLLALFPQSVLSCFQLLMFRYSTMSPVLLLCHVLFGFNLDKIRGLPYVSVYILNVGTFCLWLARNSFLFRSLQPGAIPVKFHLTIFFQTSKDCVPLSFLHSLLGGQ